MREGFVVYDEDGRELWAVPNADARAQKEAKELIREGLAEPIYRRGGDWTSIAASARLRWIKANAPEVSVEWEDAGMNRVPGAGESAALVRVVKFEPPAEPSTRHLGERRTRAALTTL